MLQPRGRSARRRRAILAGAAAAGALARSAPVQNYVVQKASDYMSGSPSDFPAQPKRTYAKKSRKPRRTRPKTNKKLSNDVKSIKKKLRSLEHSENASLGQLTYRNLRAYRVVAATASEQKVADSLAVNNITAYESVLGELLYYNPSAPATLVNAAGTSGTYQKDFLFKTVFGKLTLKNNYQTDCKVLVYLCTPRADTSQSPSSAWTDGIANDAGNVSAITDVGNLPSDFDTFRDFWKAKRVTSQVLAPGQSVQVSNAVNDVNYDPSFSDSHALLYQTKIKAFQWLVIVRGNVGHDTVDSSEVGLLQCGVDILQEETYVVNYDAGINLSYVHVNSTLDTFTNGGVESHQPVADNQGFDMA